MRQLNLHKHLLGLLGTGSQLSRLRQKSTVGCAVLYWMGDLQSNIVVLIHTEDAQKAVTIL